MTTNTLARTESGPDAKAPCPAMVNLRMAVELMHRFDGMRPDSVLLLTNLKLQQELLEQVHAELPCEPQISGGRLVCPLAHIVGDLMGMLMAAPQPQE